MSARSPRRPQGFSALPQMHGWGGHIILLTVCVVGLNTTLQPAFYSGPGRSLGLMIVYALMVGIPLLSGLFWVLARSRKERRRLRCLAGVDPVTGLSNRSSFVKRMQRVLPQSGVMLLLDIDEFRWINERRGRRVGDLCLMALAQQFRELTRATDVVGRLDGPTYAVYLPGATVEQAYAIADRLSQGVLLVSDQRQLRFTTSVGAVFANGCTPVERLLCDASAALERAKLQGRATVVLKELRMVA